MGALFFWMDGNFVWFEHAYMQQRPQEADCRRSAETIRLTGHDAEIKERIKEQVNGAEVYNVSTWEDAEVINHEVVEIGEIDQNIVSIDDESCEVSFDVDVKYLVEVPGPDTANAIWDKETGHMYTFDEITREDVKNMNFGVEISLFFEVLDDNFERGDVDIGIKGIHRGIEVSVEEYPDLDAP